MVAKHAAVKQTTAKKRDSGSNLRDVRTKAGSAAPALDRLIHERLRLGIVSALAANESLTFNDLKALMNTSDGNLSVHARKLEEAGYISCAKYFEGRLPRTEYRLTAAGRRALDNYLNHMEKLIAQMRNQE
ncbi:MAG TPA: transcriptional regulator [Pyrinomonadaceae bacterium]|nr:transcriptional regulator [Pyrinomonadaceae bacterium]